jgi:hypothetical protein
LVSKLETSDSSQLPLYDSTSTGVLLTYMHSQRPSLADHWMT